MIQLKKLPKTGGNTKKIDIIHTDRSYRVLKCWPDV